MTKRASGNTYSFVFLKNEHLLLHDVFGGGGMVYFRLFLAVYIHSSVFFSYSSFGYQTLKRFIIYARLLVMNELTPLSSSFLLSLSDVHFPLRVRPFLKHTEDDICELHSGIEKPIQPSPPKKC